MATEANGAWTPDVCVVGTGYVGLPLCIMLARAGERVLGVDVQARVVAGINAGTSPFDEEALAAAFHDPVVRTNLRAQLTPAPAATFIIAVPTPVDPRKRVADLRFVEAAITAILPHLRPGNLLIIESTIPPLTCREVVAPMIEQHGLRVGEDVLVAHCPERILPGDILHEIVANDRIIGGMTPAAAARARDLYATFVTGRLLLTDDVTAELCKLMENTYRDVNIALANEFAAVCGTLGVNVIEAINLANQHPRVDILKPGIGTGGHCIPVDPWFIRQVAPDHAQLIETARRINSAVPVQIAAQIRRVVADLAAPHLCVVGVSYKPNTADCRESPARAVIDLLRADGYDLTVVDPVVPESGWPAGGLREAARETDCLVILVEHAVVRHELAEGVAAIRAAMRTPRILRFYPAATERPAPWQAPLSLEGAAHPSHTTMAPETA